MGKWLVLGLKQEIHKMGFENLLVPESKEMLKNKHEKNKQKPKTLE